MNAPNDYIKKIKSHLQNAVNLNQNCKIYVFTEQSNSWSFYFKKGDLAWASSSNHRFRRLYRLINKFCPNTNYYETKLREQEITELWELLFLNILYKRKKISKDQLREIVQEIIKEVLFDCYVIKKQKYQIKVIFETKGNQMGAILNSSLFEKPIANLDYSRTSYRIESLVNNWENTPIGNYSPNLAPVIQDITKLKKAVNDVELYQQLFLFIDGEKTIRDLALAGGQDLIAVANHLAPHIKSKAIALQEIPDRQLPHLYFSPSNQEVNVHYLNKSRDYVRESDLPLIICVDDDSQVCQHITQLFNPIGYRIISVKDGAKTLIVLLENKPKLIFINANMPDINGYELCAQIKRMSGFKSIPIIILSKKERLVGKVRRKISGATDIIYKPLNSNEVLTVTQKYTQNFVDRKVLSASNK